MLEEETTDQVVNEGEGIEEGIEEDVEQQNNEQHVRIYRL